MLICWGVVPLWSIIADCELIFSRAPPVGIFRVWAERVRVCKTASGPASLCSLECSFRGSVVPSYTDCIHLNPKPEVDWPIASGSQGGCLSTYGTGGSRYALGSSSLAGGRPPPEAVSLIPACLPWAPALPPVPGTFSPRPSAETSAVSQTEAACSQPGLGLSCPFGPCRFNNFSFWCV